MSNRTISALAREHSHNDLQAIQLLLSHAVEMAQGLPAASVDLDHFMLLRTYSEQLLSAVFKALEEKQ